LWGGGEGGLKELLLGDRVVIVVGLEGVRGGVQFAVIVVVVVVVGAVEVEIEGGGLEDGGCGFSEMVVIVLGSVMGGRESKCESRGGAEEFQGR